MTFDMELRADIKTDLDGAEGISFSNFYCIGMYQAKGIK